MGGNAKPYDVIILSGSRHLVKPGQPHEYWYPELAQHLSDHGMNVLYPKLPGWPNQSLTTGCLYY